MPPVIDRVGAEDMMQLAGDVGPAPAQVGALLVLDVGPGWGVDLARRTMAERVEAVPRLRQRLVRGPFGCGRPTWSDDPRFTVGRHVRSVPCPAPGDRRALLDVTAGLLTTRLPFDRPPWSATFVTGLRDGRVGLVIVFHHVLADGLGGLAVLAELVDGTPPPPSAEFPRRAPTAGQLAFDALRSRIPTSSRIQAGLRGLRQAHAELGTMRGPRAADCSLNAQTGPHRTLTTVRVDLAAVRRTAHENGATVNDVILSAIAGAVRELLASRGETIADLTVSMPVAGHATTTAARSGNRVGMLPVTLPTDGDPLRRLRRIADITRARKASAPAASAVVLTPLFRALGALGALRLLRWFINHQHRVNTFVTNMRGPDNPFSFNGAPVVDVIPVGLATGNVTVAFAVLSYAGALTVTINADPDRCPDVPLLAAALRDELAFLRVRDPVGFMAAGR